MAEQATIRAILRTSKTYADGNHPICISISKHRKPKYRVIKGLTCPKSYWNPNRDEVRQNHPKAVKYNQIIKDALEKYREAQLKLMEEDKEITPDRIIQKAEGSVQVTRVLDFYQLIISELREKGKVSNAEHYEDVRKQFENFLQKKGKAELIFSEIDFALLNEWETYLRGREVKETTLFAYFKNLRALYREAIRRGSAKESEYPFKEFKLSKFNTTTQKRAISVDEVKAIEDLDLSLDLYSKVEARNFALFTYYSFGMNLTDMAYLRWKDIHEGFIYYRRKKTGKYLNVPLLDKAKEIIEEFRPFTGDRTYVFPILDPEKHESEMQRYNRIHKVRTRVNKALKEIGKRAGVEEKITLYTFRHSFATHLHHKGVPAKIIQEALDHETERQTRQYLKELDSEHLREYGQKLE